VFSAPVQNLSAPVQPIILNNNDISTDVRFLAPANPQYQFEIVNSMSRERPMDVVVNQSNKG